MVKLFFNGHLERAEGVKLKNSDSFIQGSKISPCAIFSKSPWTKMEKFSNEIKVLAANFNSSTWVQPYNFIFGLIYPIIGANP
jgi:hypothetical protein